MGPKQKGPGRSLAVWALMAMMLLAGQGWAAENADLLRKQALQLNRITGLLPAEGKIREMLQDTTSAKKLVTEAATLAKGKQQPFNVNATFILARVAQGVKQVDISQQFYRLNVEQALKLQSGSRLSLAYGSLIDLLFDNKRYEESEKVCR